jgi:phosphoribosylaminoimidazole-succinocarboxamide synthase
MRHHFLGWITPEGQPVSATELASLDTAPWMKVRSLEVLRPHPFTLDRYTLYSYSHPDPVLERPFLIPLEVVFRFGMPQGSSLEKRLAQNPHYYAELGLSTPPVKETLFERPVLEFFTKLEPKDRFLTPQEAFLIAGLSEPDFRHLYDMALLASLWLYQVFAAKGITLWDGKFEFAWTPQGLMLVDSIGPDELRLMVDGVHLSKEVIRQFYTHTPWEMAVREAKQRALSQPGSNWKAICQTQLGQTPLPLSARQKELVDNLYGALANHLLETPIVPTAMPLADVLTHLQQSVAVNDAACAARP